MAKTWLWRSGQTFTLYLDDVRLHGDQIVFKIKGNKHLPARLRSTYQEVEGVDLLEFNQDFCKISFDDEVMEFKFEEPTLQRENLIAQGIMIGPKIHVSELF